MEHWLMELQNSDKPEVDDYMQQLHFIREVSGILNCWYVASYMDYNSKIRSLGGSI